VSLLRLSQLSSAEQEIYRKNLLLDRARQPFLARQANCVQPDAGDLAIGPALDGGALGLAVERRRVAVPC
jgi:hypothetical protein